MVEGRIQELSAPGGEVSRRWLAFKLLEGDRQVLEEVNIRQGSTAGGQGGPSICSEAHGEDIEALMADARYAQAAGLTREVLKKPEVRPHGADRKDRPDGAEPLPGHPDLPGRHVAGVQADLRPVRPFLRLDRRHDRRPVQALDRGPAGSRPARRTGSFPWSPTG